MGKKKVLLQKAKPFFLDNHCLYPRVSIRVISVIRGLFLFYEMQLTKIKAQLKKAKQFFDRKLVV